MNTVYRLVVKAVRFELAMWRSLWRWIARRPRAEAGAQAFGYAGPITPLLIGFIVVSAIEIPIVDLILPWQSARIAALVLGLQGVFWMLGLLASLRVHPHVIGPSGLRVRYGAGLDFTVPWHAIATITPRTRALQSSRTVHTEGASLSIAISSQTNIRVTLREPITVPLPKGDSDPITELNLYADDPTALLTAAREQLPATEPA